MSGKRGGHWTSTSLLRQRDAARNRLGVANRGNRL